MIRSGKVLFPKKGTEDLIQQLVYFGVEKHDDLVDAFTMVLYVSLEVKYYDIRIIDRDLLGL